jgi:heterodisulfide reductase subunit B
MVESFEKQGVTLGQSRLAEAIREALDQDVFLCYQCVKCTAGCPLAEYFDLTPNQVMRAVQLGQEELALNSRTIWLCASCQTCTTRCPQGLDVAGIMDRLKMIARERGIEPKVREVALFHKVFLKNVDLLGRVYELGLMAEMNLRTGEPFKDLPMGLEMLRRRKLSLLPALARPPKDVQPVPEPDSKVAYYPGCSLHGLASEFNASAQAVCKALDVELVEPQGWICCGSTAAHSTDELLATSLPLTNLALIERSGLREVTLPCAACFNRFKTAVYEIEHDPELKQKVDEKIGYAYQDTVKVESLLELVVDKVGLGAVKKWVRQPLEGLKVACYYGCLLTRPAHIIGAPHPEYPMQMDYLMRVLGAEVLDWSYKTSCCGASLSVTQTDVALDLSRKILEEARAVGADAIIVACPLCHANLDGRQAQMNLDEPIPVLYFTQLMALAFGLGEKAAALTKNMVDPRPMLREKGLLTRS